MFAVADECRLVLWLAQLYSADKSPDLGIFRQHVMGVCGHGGV